MPRAPEAGQESRKRFISTVLGESQPKSKLPANRGEEGIEGTQETVGRSVEPSLSPQHSGLVPQSLENLSEHRPAEQKDDWLADLPRFQTNSPLAQDLSTAQPAETISVQERVRQETLREPEPLAVEQSVDEMRFSSFPVLSESPEPPSFYKSRPFQILAVMVLLGVGFFLFRGPGSFVTKKPDTALQQQSGNAQPERQVSSSPTGSETANPPGVGTEPGKPETVSAPSVNPQPEIKVLTPNETHSVSSAAAPHNAEAISPSRGLPGEDSHATPSSGPRLVISDVTGEGGPPYLQRSKKPIVSPDMARSSKPLVVRVVIGRQGKVIEATSLNQSESNASLSRAALAAVQNWEFSPARGKSEKTWTRYFSFRFTSGSE
jgi:TonB family protein